MCVEYERTIALTRLAEFYQDENPSFVWSGVLPDPSDPQTHIRVGGSAAIVGIGSRELVGKMMTWGWTQGRQIFFNLKSEDRDVPHEHRILIPATGYYEYTEPMEPRIAGSEKHLFTVKDEEWFWIAGIVREGRFAMLTAKARPEVKPFCKRQMCVLRPSKGVDWLTLAWSLDELVQQGPRLNVRTHYESAKFAYPAQPRRHSDS
jgi:hypothetical protein